MVNKRTAGYSLAIVGACLVLAFQAWASRMLSFDEKDIPSPELHQIPMSFGDWQSNGEQSLDQAIVDALMPDVYILRDYSRPGDGAKINLFVAHFKSLDKTYGPHSPRICLPGSGWVETSARITTIQIPGRSEGVPVNELTYEQGSNRILVLYWYQNNRRIWAEEFQAKLTLLPDLIKYRRSDVSLVRLVTALPDSESHASQLANCVAFAKTFFPSLSERIGPTQ